MPRNDYGDNYHYVKDVDDEPERRQGSVEEARSRYRKEDRDRARDAERWATHIDRLNWGRTR